MCWLGSSCIPASCSLALNGTPKIPVALWRPNQAMHSAHLRRSLQNIPLNNIQLPQVLYSQRPFWYCKRSCLEKEPNILSEVVHGMPVILSNHEKMLVCTCSSKRAKYGFGLVGLNRFAVQNIFIPVGPQYLQEVSVQLRHIECTISSESWKPGSRRFKKWQRGSRSRTTARETRPNYYRSNYYRR
jgi:hypothetical protein